MREMRYSGFTSNSFIEVLYNVEDTEVDSQHTVGY